MKTSRKKAVKERHVLWENELEKWVIILFEDGWVLRRYLRDGKCGKSKWRIYASKAISEELAQYFIPHGPTACKEERAS